VADPLEAILRPVAKLLNRNIAATTPARELCARLRGKIIAVRVRDTSLAMYFRFAEDSVSLASEYAEDPDVVITGSLLTLARLTTVADDDTGGFTGIDLTGDIGTARSFQRLLGFAKPDVEEELSAVIGDTAARQVGQFVRGVGRWAREAGTTMTGNVREYLQEESRDLPSQYEFETFAERVDALRDDVARLEARMRRLERGG
jgi:ubiquinone biosynthesis protein UbiJ